MQTWDSPEFLSQSVELPGAAFEHRQILASKKFHDTLVEYLTDSVAVYVLEAKGLKSMDSGGTSDPFCECWMENRLTGRKTTKRATKTLLKDINPVYNERFAFGIESSIEDLDTLVFQIWDHDTLGNDLIGTTAGEEAFVPPWCLASWVLALARTWSVNATSHAWVAVAVMAQWP